MNEPVEAALTAVLAAAVAAASLILAAAFKVTVSPTAIVEPVMSLKVIVKTFPAPFQTISPSTSAVPQLCPPLRTSQVLRLAAVIAGLFVF